MLCGATYRWKVGAEHEPLAAENQPHAPASERWRQIDGRLRRIAKHRAEVDHEELSLIREAIRLAIWRELGMTSIREYLEHVMDYSPVVASERVRVAEALDAMPALDRALATGELSFSAVREISRIATRKTEAGWVATCRSLNLRQIEDLLAEREPGDRPDSPRNPDLRMRDLRFKARPATEAAVRLARQQLEAERGEPLDQDELLNALAQCVLSGGSARTRAATQVAITVCRSCGIARQSAAGRDIALRPDELECALCDAEWIDLEGKRRARQDITPATRKIVRLRDGDRCRVPGCRAARNVDVHHIVHRAQGGSHEPDNLVMMCSGHHAAHHRGQLSITGNAASAVFQMTAANAVVEMTTLASIEAPSDGAEAFAERVGSETWPGTVRTGAASDPVSARESRASTTTVLHVENPAADFHVESACADFHVESPAADFHVEAERGSVSISAAPVVPRLAGAELEEARADAVLALRGLGFTRSESVNAVDGALAQGDVRSLEDLLRAALRRCPRPTS